MILKSKGKKNFRRRLFVANNLLLVVFLLSASILSFVVSSSIIRKSVYDVLKREQIILVDYIHHVYDDLSQELALFASKLSYDDRLKEDLSDSFLQRDLRDKINAYLKTVVLSGDSYKALFVVTPEYFIGNVDTNVIEKKPFLSFDLIKNDDESKEIIMNHLGNFAKEFKSEEMIIARIDDKRYLIGFIDLDAIISNRNENMLILNSNSEVIHDSLRNQKVSSEFENIVELEMGKTWEEDKYLYSFYRESNGSSYLLEADLTEFFDKLSRIRNWMILVGGSVFILFVIIGIILQKQIFKPLIGLLELVEKTSTVNDIEKLKKYRRDTYNYQSVRKQIFSRFMINMFAVLFMFLFSYGMFRTLLFQKIDDSYYQVSKQMQYNIEYEIARVENFLRYFSVDQDFQTIFINDELTNNSMFISDLFIRKGMLEKSVNYVNLYNRNGEKFFKSSDAYRDIFDTDLMEKAQEVGVYVRIRQDDFLKNTLSFILPVRFLPLEGGERSEMFKVIGYIEIGIDRIFEYNQDLESDVRFSFTVLDQNMHAISNDMNLSFDDFNNLKLEDTNRLISIDGGQGRNYYAIHQIEKSDFYLFTQVESDMFNEDDAKVILYHLILIVIFIILIYEVTKLIGNRMVYNVMVLKQKLEKDVVSSEDFKIDIKETEYEFAVLAKAFSDMLVRLENISNELREKEIRNIDLEKRRAIAQLNALQAQINPHFMFNIFTSIRLLLKNGKISDAEKIIQATGKLFRISLESKQDKVTLEEELNHVEHYMEIQKIRFEHNIEVISNIEGDLQNIKIPKFTIQPLVENVIEHGIDSLMHVNIWINAFAKSDKVIIEIKDDGVGMDEHVLDEIRIILETNKESEHYGLKNVYDRLKLIFGDSANLLIESERGKYTKVTMVIDKESVEG